MSDLRNMVDVLESIVGHVGAVSWVALAFGLCFQLVKLAATARAWQGILRASYPDAAVGFPGVFAAYLSAVGLNAVLPARTGEVARLALAKRMVAGSSYPALAATIVVETLIDAALLAPVLAVAVSVGLVAGGVIPWSNIAPVFDHPGLIALAGIAVMILGAIVIRAGFRRREWLRALAVEARRGFSVFGARRGELARVAAWQAAALLCRVVAVWWFLKAFHLPATPRVVVAVLAVQVLSTLVPLLPGGAGTQQAMLLVVLGGLVPASALLGFSVGTQAFVAAFDVVLGLVAVAILLRTFNIRRSLRALHADRAASPPVSAPVPSDG